MVCGQCHVEYYCGPKTTLFFPWNKGMKVEQIEATYDEYKFHSHSGGGRIVMAMSLDDGRSEVTDAMRDIVFQCTLCGGCEGLVPRS